MTNALRTALNYAVQDQQQAALEREQGEAAGMGSIRRSYNATRIGTDLNANRADQATLRMLGRDAEADALQQQADALQQRQGMYAPEVGRVEDIKGLGDAASWFGTQVGQGFASMQDPLALAAGGTAVGNAVSAVPRLRALGAAIKGLSQAGAFGLNQRQMTGEMYGRLQEDPEAFKNMSAKEAFAASNLYGVGAGALESLLPGAVGHALGGSAAKQVLKGSMPGAVRTIGGGVLLEGTTELGQEYGQQRVHDIYNPNRDRTEDSFDLLNAFAGGAAGGSPMAGMHAVANSVSRRRSGDRPAPVDTDRGGVVDLENPSTGPQGGPQEGSGGPKRGARGVVDLGGAAVRAARDAGRTDHATRVEEAEARMQRAQLPPEEYAAYEGLTGDPTKLGDPDLEAQVASSAYSRLDQMVMDGDPRAEALLDALDNPDPVAQGEAIREAAAFLKAEHDRAATEYRSATREAIIGGATQALGRGAARVAGGVARAAAAFAANAIEGARQAGAGKKNLQGVDGSSSPTYEDWTALRQNKLQAEGVRRLASPADPDDMRRAEMYGQLFASEAERRFPGGRADFLARTTAFQLYDLIGQSLEAQTPPTDTQVRAVVADLVNLFDVQTAADLIGRVAQTTPPAGRRATDAAGRMLEEWGAQAQLKRTSDEVMADQMLALLPVPLQRQIREGRETQNMLEFVRLASEVGLPKVVRQDADEKFGAENFNRMLEIYGATLREQEAPGPTAEDLVTPGRPLSSDDIDAGGEETGDFERRQGERKLDKMSSPSMYMFHGERAHTVKTSDGNRRNPRNPFEPDRGDMSKEDWAKQEADAKELGFVNAEGRAISHKPRPRLFDADSPAAAREGLADKIAQMEKNLGVERTPEAYAKEIRQQAVGDLTVDERKMLARLDDLEARAADGDADAQTQLARDAQDFFADRRGQFSVEAVSAAQVLDGMGMQRAGRLALYRDMMFQEARRAMNAQQPTAQTRATAADSIAQAAAAHRALVKEMRGDKTPGRKLTTGERHAIAEARRRIEDSAGLQEMQAWVKKNLGDAGVKRFQEKLAGIEGRRPPEQQMKDGLDVIADVDDAMQRYFERGYMVRATSLSDRAPGEITVGTVVELARSGARIRSEADKRSRVDGDSGAVAAAEGGLLNFKQPAGRNMLGTEKGEPGDLAIPTEALVNWVRQNRREDFANNADGEKLREKDSKRDMNAKFIADLAEGISALVGSGLVEGQPYVLGADGRQQRFAGVDGVPDALQLPSMTGAQYKQEVEARAKRVMYAKAAERREALQEIAGESGLELRKPADLARAEEILAARQEAERQERIGKDQSRDEPITQDPLIGLADNARYSREVDPDARGFVRGLGERVKPRSTAYASRDDVLVSDPAPDPQAHPTAYSEAKEANASAVARRAAERKARLERSNKSAPSDETPLQRAARLKRLEESEASRTAEEVRRSLRTGGIKETPPVTRSVGGKEVTLVEGEKYREARRTQASPTVQTNESWTAFEDDVTPLDTQLFLGEERAKAEFDEQRQRSGELPRTAYEIRASALKKANDRAQPILDKLRSTIEGKPEHRQDVAGALADVRMRLRTAARKGQEGGIQYAFPLVHVLNPEVISAADLTDQQARDFDLMRSALATLLADNTSLTPYERTQLTKAMVDPMHAAKVTAANAQQVLNKGAQKYRDHRAQRLAERQAKRAAPEVAAGRDPKSSAPRGGVEVNDHPSSGYRDGTTRKLSLQGAVVDAMSAREIMRELGFKTAPPQFTDVAAKLLADPDVHPADFARQSAEALSHLMMQGERGEAIRKALSSDFWREQRLAIAAKLAGRGVQRGDALTDSYRVLVERALRQELNERGIAERTFAGRVMQMVKDFMSKFRELTNTERFQDLVRNSLNDMIRSGPADLRADFKKVTFQEAVDADPQAAGVLAHMSKLKGVGLTGSIVLALSGPVYRNAANMLHDLDLLVNDREAAMAHLTSAFPDAQQIYDFNTSNAKIDTFLVPPAGTTIRNIVRERGEKGRVLGHEVVRDGRVIGRVWTEDGIEQKTGVTATMVDLMSDHKAKFVRTATFTTGGQTHSVAVPDVAHIFGAKLRMGRDKDLNDYRRFVPSVGRKLNAQGTEGQYEGWKDGPTAREQRAKGRVATDEEIAQAREYVDRVLGPKIRVEFENTTEYSGEWIGAEDTIRLSVMTNAGIINVARHEALHAFFSKFIENNPKARAVMESLVDNPQVVRRLQHLLRNEPAALEQLRDGEERLAYIYQFAMAGMLRLPHTPGTTLMGKVRKFLRRVFMMVRDDERAVDLLTAFEAGQMRDPDAASRVIAKILNQGTWARSGPGRFGALTTRVAGMVSSAHTILMENVSPTAREIGRLAFANPGDENDGDRTGYLNARNQKIRQYTNVMRSVLNELTPEQMRQLTEVMQNETPQEQIDDPAVAKAREGLRGLFERFHTYLTDERRVRVGKIEKDYFPVVFDPEAVTDGRFAKMLLTKYADDVQGIADLINANRRMQARSDGVDAPADLTAREVVDGIVNRIARVNPLDDFELDPLREDGVLRPWFASGEKRMLKFLKPEDRAQFQEKDITKIVTRYIHQGVRTAEYSVRFGRNGAVLHRMLKDAEKELVAASEKMMASGDFKNEKQRETWVKRQYANVANAVGAIEGSLGRDIPEWWRNTSSAAIVYQNIRLLPLALFASFVDPLGIAVRGGSMSEAFSAFTRGMREVGRNWADMLREQPLERKKDEWEALAELAGVIDSATFSHMLSDEYGSNHHRTWARAANETMFKANGLESWNRAMRIAATQSAVKFMLHHNQGSNQHSVRWMKELGFNVGELPVDSNGQLITRKDVLMREQPHLSESEATAMIERVHSGIVRWVEGAILSPNAAHRPAWSSDPHFGMFWHLKQFAYSFHHTMLTRAKNEARHGNYAPIGALAWYVPMMIGADVTKAMMLGAGELPGYMKGYDLGDWVMHGLERGGTFGKLQIGLDAWDDPSGLAGPMVDQVWDAIVDPAERTLVRALPANALYSRAIF